MKTPAEELTALDDPEARCFQWALAKGSENLTSPGKVVDKVFANGFRWSSDGGFGKAGSTKTGSTKQAVPKIRNSTRKKVPDTSHFYAVGNCTGTTVLKYAEGWT